MYEVKQSAALTVLMFAHDANGDAVNSLTDGSWTKRISKNGAAFAAMTVTITFLENGWYSVPLSTAHTDTLGILTLTFTNAGCKQVNLQYRVSARIADDLAFPAVSGRSLAVEADGMAHADLKEWLGVAPSALITGRVDANTQATAATLVFNQTGNVSGSVGSVTGAVGSVTAAVTVGTINANVITATAINAGAITSAKFGANAIDAAAVADGAIDAATFAAGAINAAAIATGAITNTKFAAGAIDAAAIATDAIGAAELAADAVAEIQSGLATSVALATVQADTDDIQTRLPAALIGGRMDANAQVVGDKTGYTLTTPDKDEIVDLVWDEVLTAATHNVNNSSGKRLREIQAGSTAFSGNIIGTPTATVVRLDGTASSTDDFYRPGLAIITSSFGVQFARVASYNGTTRDITLASALATVPNSGDDITITPWASVRVSDIDDGVIVAATMDAGFANKMADHVWRRTLANVRASADGDALNFRSGLGAASKLVNRWAVATGVLTVYQEDDTTAFGTQNVTGTAGADPITQLDTV